MSIKILTTLLTKEEIGNYYLLLSILTLLNFTFLNPLGQYYGRHIIHWKNNNNLSNATHIILFLRLAAIIFLLFIAFLLYEIFEYEKYYSLDEFLIFIFVLLISGTNALLLNVVNIMGDRIKFISYTILTLLVGLFLSLLIVNFFDKTAMGWIYGFAISELFFLLGLYKFVVKNNKFSYERVILAFKKEHIKKVLYFILPVTATLFLQWAQNQSYRFIIEMKYSLEILAFIGVGLAISASIFSAVESLATQYYNPIYLRKITNATKVERENAWNELAKYMIPIYLTVAIYVIILAPYLTNLLVSKSFNDAYIYAMFGALIEFFRVITNLVYTVSQSEVRTNSTIMPYLVGFVISTITIYFIDVSDKIWLIPFFLIISSSIIFLILFKNMKKILEITINMRMLIKTLILNLPLFIVLIFENQQSLIQSIYMIGLSGIYILLIVYFIIKQNKGYIK